MKRKLLQQARGPEPRRSHMMYTDDPSAWIEIGGPYKLYFQSRGEMFIGGNTRSNDTQFLAFQFFNVTDLDIAELRKKLAQMDMLNSSCTSASKSSALLLFLTVDADAGPCTAERAGAISFSQSMQMRRSLIDTNGWLFYSSEKLRSVCFKGKRREGHFLAD